MQKLRTIEDKVRAILKKDEEARNDDMVLYLKVCKKFIDDYAYKKYGQSDRVDYSDLSKIEIATATTEDGQRKFMVMLDLENYRMKFYENGKCTDYTEYLKTQTALQAGRRLYQ